MRKLISTVFLITVLSIAAFADDGHINSPGATCIAGHINSPGIVCTQPEDGEGENRGAQPDDNSVIIVIQTFLSDYNPFRYFLN